MESRPSKDVFLTGLHRYRKADNETILCAKCKRFIIRFWAMILQSGVIVASIQGMNITYRASIALKRRCLVGIGIPIRFIMGISV